MKKLNKKAKNLDIFDIGLTKMAVLSATLFLVTMFPKFLNLANKANPWCYAVAAIILSIRPMYRFLK